MKVKFTSTAITVDYASEYSRYEDTNPDPEMGVAKSRFEYCVYFDRELTENEVDELKSKFQSFYWAGFELNKGGEVWENLKSAKRAKRLSTAMCIMPDTAESKRKE
jgi:hypothetical protein